MPAGSKHEPRSVKHVFYGMIGSAGFKWALGGIGSLAIFLFVLGANAWARSQATVATAPQLVAAKADVDTVKVAVAQVERTAQVHTTQLQLQDQKLNDSREAQQRIFNSLQALSADVHNLDVHLGKVEQKIDDRTVLLSAGR